MGDIANYACGGCCCLVFFILIILIPMSFKRLEENEYGLQYTKYGKQLDDTPMSGGLFIGPPGFQFIKFPATFVTVDLAETCVSKDGLRVEYEVTFQYQAIPDLMYDAVIKYRDFTKWNRVVRGAGASAIQHSCSNFTISSFQNKRGDIQRLMEDNLRLKLEGNINEVEREGDGDIGNKDDYGVFARAISLQLRNIELPSEYQAAVAEKQSAEEDIALAQNQRKQEVTKAQTDLLAAQEEARKIRDTALNEADVLLTEARLEAEETIFSFEKETETLVGVKENLGLTTEGLLSYAANQLLEEAAGVRVSAGEPARLSRRDEL